MVEPESTWECIRMTDIQRALAAEDSWRMGINLFYLRLTLRLDGQELMKAQEMFEDTLEDICMYGEDDCGCFLDRDFKRVKDYCQTRLHSFIDELLRDDFEWKQVIKRMLMIVPEDRLAVEQAYAELSITTNEMPFYE